jgi:hypothetical protein
MLLQGREENRRSPRSPGDIMPDIDLMRLGERMREMMEKQDRMQDDITILTGIAMRVDATLQGLVAEVRALHRQRARLEREDTTLSERLAILEARIERLEQREPG